MKHVWLLLALVLVVVPASAQVSITEFDLEDRIENRGTTISFTAEDPENAGNIVNATGSNATYDFTVFTYTRTDSTVIAIEENSSAIPGNDNDILAAAEYVFRPVSENLDVYSFFSLESNGFFSHGTYSSDDFDMDGTEDEVLAVFDPPLLNWELPLNEGSDWESESTQTSVVMASTAGEITSMSEISEVVEVEGSGTLVTPDGSASSLRLRRERTVTVSGFEMTTVTIEFVTEGDLSATVALDATGTPISASYSIFAGEGGGPTAIETVSDDIPEAFMLSQNYPNPFNPETTIPFGVKQAGPVSLVIYDALGREVATLIDQLLAVGSYTANFEAADLPSGVYFYQLRAGDVVRSRAMLLHK